jgi:hypothetical protein
VVHGGRSAWGNAVPKIWDVEWSNAKIVKIKYTVGLIGRQPADQNRTTNQKQLAVMEGSMEGIWDEWDAWGKRDAIISGHCKLDRG